MADKPTSVARAIVVLNSAMRAYLANGALSRGAAISFYAITSLAPVLLIIVAVAGIAFGQGLVRDNLVVEATGLFGRDGAELIRSMLAQSSDPSSSTAATIFGLLMVLLTASGVFGEMQTALNTTWKAQPLRLPLISIARARTASLGLVAALGFLLMVSLAVSTGLSALGKFFSAQSSFTPLLLSLLNTAVSITLFTLLFGAIFRILPDVEIAWRDVRIGALLTALMFTIGKSLIGWYLGTMAASSGNGAAGALIAILLWAYYSAQIFLFGAEVTKAISDAR